MLDVDGEGLDADGEGAAVVVDGDGVGLELPLEGTLVQPGGQGLLASYAGGQLWPLSSVPEQVPESEDEEAVGLGVGLAAEPATVFTTMPGAAK
mmetsp:Transcript_14362/g.22871  ORF Transcript_14362/g.22871 Transcript_14362/m.22871 type:complete len:94 (+) Transcript_14362:1208-1489(+)